MNSMTDPFIRLDVEQGDSVFGELERRPANLGAKDEAGVFAPLTVASGPTIAKLHGFDLLEQPLIGDVAQLPGQVLPARSAIPLRRAMIGRDVVVSFMNGDTRAPVIMGVLEPHPLAPTPVEPGVKVTVDGERHVIEAEREIVLRCGDASITLTRAGKVIIKGNYILSRSTGYNKIKGAAIDIN